MRSSQFLTLCGIAALAAALAGCSSETGKTPAVKSGERAGSADTPETAPAGKGSSGDRPKLAFISNNPFEFWTIARKGTEKAAQEFNADVEFRMPAQGTPAEQRQIIEDLLSKGVQGIAISPNDAENQASFLNEVAEQVPLLTQDSDLPPGSKRLAYIGTNNYLAGKAAGQLVKKALPKGGRVVIYVGKLDVQNAMERRQGVIDELAGKEDAEGPDLGDFELLDTMTDNSMQENCKANVEDTLAKHGGEPETLCLVGLWEYNPPAMLAAVKGAGLEGKVHIVGFDENEETLKGIKDGHIVGSIVQQPFEFGYRSIKILAGVARGDKSVIPEGGIMYVDYQVITKENVKEFWDKLRELKK
ncbi:MAG TPA: sugar-binding protein [Pirellulales bacterium]|nr:sugar-binding protein [Pirellulales bacterium]